MKKRIKLAVLSLLALAFSAPIGFCTANADAPPALDEMTVEQLKDLAAKNNVTITSDMKKADIVAALQTGSGNGGETDAQRIARLETQVERLTAAAPVALPQIAPQVSSSTALLIAGAGVDEKDVTWRIRAGLSPAQAVEVALQEKNEAKAAKEAKK